jgi:predicted regulator of Ras-like GTPase activity (Roadblock/LC7/MglB family)
MPFLNWFKSKSEKTETEAKPVLAKKLATEQANTPETVVTPIRQETGPDTLLGEHRSADAQSAPQNTVVASEVPATETNAAPHISVPIGAFYAKLPGHLLAPKTPDLARSVQISELDLVRDQETQEVTLPLSILSLSCPEIFVRAVDGSDDVPVTFSLNQPEELEPAAAEDSVRLKERETGLSPTAAAPATGVEAGGHPTGGEKEIKLRLEAIFSDFPLELEPPAIHSLMGTQAEIALPLELIQSQLAHGRVVVPAETFCRALPSDLKPYFEAIDPAAEIPIPLQEIFSRLPAEAIELREDQEIDRPEETVPTPFSAQAEEDAKRFGQVPAGLTAPVNEAPQPKDEPSKAAVASDSKRLQAIFMTDEPLDLAGTIHKVAGLPGLRSCVLSTTDGLTLAGNLDDPDQEKAISALLPDLFQRTQSKLEVLRAGTLETISLYCGLHQFSTFVQGNLCLTVLHDNRPFKPGVREKIQAVISELAVLSASEKTL